MNTKLSFPFLAILALAQGCIIVGPGGPNSGNVTFAWTFLQASCSYAGVASVHITIPGETLDNNGVYACNSNGYDGIVLHDFAPGQYIYTIEGLDSAGYTTYTGSGDFDIDGDVTEQVDLAPVSYAWLTWTFPGNVTCANADTPANFYGGVKYVDIDIDGQAVRANCVDGALANGGQGVYSAAVGPGNHVITLTALGAFTPAGGQESVYPLFGASHALTTTLGAPVLDQAALQWMVGGTVVSWSLQSPTGTAQACDTANRTPYVYVNFVDSTNTAVYAQPGDANYCNAVSTKYYYLQAAAGGTNYRIDMQGAAASYTWSQVGTHPVVTVMPGVFPADTSAINVTLRQN